MEDKLERVNKRLKDARNELDKHLDKAHDDGKRLRDRLYDLDEGRVPLPTVMQMHLMMMSSK